MRQTFNSDVRTESFNNQLFSLESPDNGTSLKSTFTLSLCWHKYQWFLHLLGWCKSQIHRHFRIFATKHQTHWKWRTILIKAWRNIRRIVTKGKMATYCRFLKLVRSFREVRVVLNVTSANHMPSPYRSFSGLMHYYERIVELTILLVLQLLFTLCVSRWHVSIDRDQGETLT